MGIGDWGLGPIPNPHGFIVLLNYYIHLFINSQILYNFFKLYFIKIYYFLIIKYKYDF